MYQILVVDVERIERNGITMLLRHMQLPCEIAEAANGRDALEYLKEHTSDVLLTDVKMPFMDGIQLIEECKKDDRNEDMKCVIFSGCSEFDYARKAVRLGVSDYILKPVDPSEFKETITRVIQELEAERAEKNMKKKSMQQMRETINSQSASMEATQKVLQEVMEEIGDSMRRMSQMKQSTGELEEVRNEILASMDALSEFAQNNLASTKQTYEQTNEVADTFEKVNSSAEELRSIAAKLADSIRYFKIEK